jgi:hypothetical protein
MGRKQWFSNSIALILICLAGSFHAAGQVNMADIRYLQQLEGTWKMNTRKSTIIESWNRVNDSTWAGKTWRVVGSDSSVQQSMRLVRRGNDIYFMPTYEGNTKTNPIALKLRVLKPVGFVAEDLNNDFPRKITYRFKDARHLDARVEGTRDGTIEEYIFQYTSF